MEKESKHHTIKFEEKRSTWRTYSRIISGEILGTFLLTLIGNGSVAQLTLGTLHGGDFGSFPAIAFGNALGLFIALSASIPLSGGHLNPAVTVTYAMIKRCKWKQVPVYFLGEYIGAFLAAAVLYGIYYDAISATKDGVGGLSTAGIFATYPNSMYETSLTTLIFDQLLATALLLIMLISISDERNNKGDDISGFFPFLMAVGLAGILSSFALNSGAAINPAKDFSPRLFSYAVGWSSEVTFERDDYFFWIPLVIPHIGGPLGGIVYQLFVGYWHDEY